MRAFLWLLLLGWAGWPGWAGATPATDLLRAGDYARAYALAQAAAEAVTASTAAAALSQDGAGGAGGAGALWRERAVQAARAAVAADPRSAEAYLALGSALGLQARAGGFSLGTLRTAQEARRALEQALRLDPAQQLARAVLAHWHAAAWAKAGVFSGGNRAQAATLADTAARAAPQSVRVNVEAGLAFLALGDPTRGRTLLERSLSLPATEALDRLAQQEARAALRP